MNGTSCGFMAKIWAIWGTLILPRLLPIFLGDVPFGTEIIYSNNYRRPLYAPDGTTVQFNVSGQETSISDRKHEKGTYIFYTQLN